MPAICAAISSVAFAVWPASAFTSLATTAKPRPASPARAASIVALSASRLVCSAMSVIRRTTSPMRPAASLSSLTVALVRSASLTALPAIAFDCATWRSISVTEAASSSAADAMSRTLDEASAEAVAAPPVRLEALSAAPVSSPEAASIWSEMRPSSASVASISAPKRAISADICSCRLARAPAHRSRTVRLSSSLRRMASWNTAIERASAPTSSPRSR